MRISIVTIFESLYTPFLQTSLVGRAQEKGIVRIDVQSLFRYVQPKERIDAPVFGHGAGMLIRPDVIQKAIEEKENAEGKAFKIFFSPRGKKIDQPLLKTIAHTMQEYQHLMLLPARYEGMDARIEEHYADMIISLGDFVIMGGDLPAMVLIEGVLRCIPGVVSKEESVEKESFTNLFVDFPSYTEPVEWQGMRVPEVLRSGNHAAVDAWRQKQSVEETVFHHFSWLRSQQVPCKEKQLVKATIPAHYAALMHCDVLIGEEKVPGVTSVTSIDIHDISRSSRTYGIENFFIVTPLIDQQKIVRKMLDFWLKGAGLEYNKSRHEAIQYAEIADSLDAVVEIIEQKEGKKPVIIATSACSDHDQKKISYGDQEVVWQEQRPVLIIFGTGKGLTDEIIDRCDYLLLPLYGFTDFNHLSVRSAAAIIFDRWLGINQSSVASYEKNE